MQLMSADSGMRHTQIEAFIMTTESPSPRCAVAVLGLALGPGGVPPPELRARCERAAQLASERGDAALILTGGDAKEPSTCDIRIILRF